MATRLVTDMCREGETVAATLVVTASELRSFSSKPGRYLWLKLRDRSGEIEAKLWDARDGDVERFPVGMPVAVRGRVNKWRDRFDLVLDTVDAVDPATVDPTDFLPACPTPTVDLWDRLEAVAAVVDDADLQRLLGVFFGDAELRQTFGRAPASRGWHHGYLGGLLEHTVAVAEICRAQADGRPGVDRSLLVTGAILHDLGKVDDYRCDTVIDHTLSGKLLGHIVTGHQRLVELAARVPGFPYGKLVRLAHIVVSHHGREEWGSPKRPKTLEAQVVHYADNLDAQANGFGLVVDEGRARGVRWSGYHALLGTDVLCSVPDGDD